ncbi:MAG TPA: hypothetical protein V6C81_02465 [Planktothrix sp.]
MSVFLAAISVFAAVNLCLAYGYERARQLQCGLPVADHELCDRYLRNIRVWDEAAIDSAIGSVPAHPNVVLAGSSAMIAPFWSADRSADKRVSSRLWLHHTANLLTDECESKTVTPLSIYNIATPLQMVSDTYVYCDKLLKGPTRPSLLLLGVTPREFYDHDFPEPDKTLNFLAAAPYSNWNYLNVYSPTWQSRFDYLAEQLSFVYSKRSVLQTALVDEERRYADRHLPTAEKERGFYSLGIEQYMRRYTGFTVTRMEPQLRYLQLLSALCQKRDTELAVINLPVPSANRILLGDEYEGYCKRLKDEVQSLRGDVDYIDLSHSPLFPDGDFADAIHLDAAGGKTLIGILAPYIRKELADGDHQIAAM